MRRPPPGAFSLLSVLLVACADAPGPAIAPAQTLQSVRLLSSSFSPTPTVVPTQPPVPTAAPTRPPPTATKPAPSPTATKPAPTATTKAISPTPKVKPSATPLQSFTDPFVVQIGLKAKLPVTAVQVLNATNDPDKLLGKLNGYPAKIAFQDPRIGNAHGFVELFADDKSLKARLSYLQAQEKAGAIGPVSAGMKHKVIFRLPKGLSPAQMQTYRAAFGM
jgi:hypothetical protein